MTKIIAVVNQKGGVGKTTTTINLVASLVNFDKRVLLVDLDPQGNATMGCGCDKDQQAHTINEVLLREVNISHAIQHLEALHFDLVPANSELTTAEIHLLDEEEREMRLKSSLETVAKDYDYIFLDCPPSLNMLTINALVAAESVLIPLQCEYFALEGLSSLVKTIEQIQQSANPNLYIEGIVRTMYDGRNRLSMDVSDTLLEHFEDKVFETVIPRNVRLAEAPSHGIPIIDYDRRSVGAAAYLALADEMLCREDVLEEAV